MPTLEEMRSRFAPRPAGVPARAPAAPPSPASTSGAPTDADEPEAPATGPASPGGGVDVAKLRRTRATSAHADGGPGGRAAPPPPPPAGHGKPRYTVSADGTDAVLHFGKYAEQSVSELARAGTSAGYLRWMLSKEFPNELNAIIRRYV